MNAIHNTVFRDISPASSLTPKQVEYLNAFMIPAMAKEDLPESMKVVLRSIVGPLPNVTEQPPQSSTCDGDSKPLKGYSQTVIPPLQLKAEGYERMWSGIESSRRHAEVFTVFNGEKIYSRRYRKQNLKNWLARNILCIR